MSTKIAPGDGGRAPRLATKRSMRKYASQAVLGKGDLKDLRDPESDMRKEIEYSFIPLCAYLMDCLQFNAAVFTMDIKWPTFLDGILKAVGDIFLISLPTVDTSYHVAYHCLILGLLVCAFVFVVPTQHLLVTLGDRGTFVVFGIALCVQTVCVMPCIRFLMKSMVCRNDHPVFLPDAECYSGVHLYYTILSPILFAFLVVLSLKWEVLTTSPIEMAKKARLYRMSSRPGPYSFRMLIIKILFVLPLTILEPLLPKVAQVCAFLVLCLAALGLLLYHRPYYFADTTAALSIPLVVASLNDIISLVVLIDPDVSQVVVMAYFAAVGPLCFCVYTLVDRWLTSDSLKDSVRSLARTFTGTDSAFVTPHFGDGDTVNLDKKLLGLSKPALMEFAQHLRRMRIKTLSMRSNEMSRLGMSTLLATLPGTSDITLTELDVGDNRNLFLRDDVFKAMNDKSSLHLTDINLDLCAGIDVVLKCCTNLRKLTLSKTRLPLSTWNAICKALASPSCAVEELDVSHCGLKKEHMFALKDLLAVDKLVSINLRYNNLQPSGARVLSEGIPQTSKLLFLDVGWNNIQVQGADHILKSINRFIDVKLECNMIQRKDFVRLKGALNEAMKKSSQGQDGDGSKEPTLDEVLQGQTIFEVLGGEAAIEAVVERFYLYLVTDPKLIPFFKNISMGRMRHLQAAFIGSVLGSVKPYRGKDMASGHAHLGITHDAFDQTVAWLFVAITDFVPNPPAAIVKVVADAVEGLRGAVVSEVQENPSHVFVPVDDDDGGDVGAEWHKQVEPQPVAGMGANSSMKLEDIEA